MTDAAYTLLRGRRTALIEDLKQSDCSRDEAAALSGNKLLPTTLNQLRRLFLQLSGFISPARLADLLAVHVEVLHTALVGDHEPDRPTRVRIGVSHEVLLSLPTGSFA